MKNKRRFFNKHGGVLAPVIGTILALTILASASVTYAITSDTIVYRDKKNEQENDARNILYICAKYFSENINSRGEAGVATYKQELQDIFAELEISKKTTSDGNIYYLYYPFTYNSDGTPATYLRTFIKLTATSAEDDPNSGGDQNISDDLFSEESKINEKYNIGNMATLFMQENGLIPNRATDSNTLSVVEADIDTFDEALTYVSGSGVLEIDNLKFVYWDVDGKKFRTVEGTDKLDVFYETGDLGGNYYWAKNTEVGFLNQGSYVIKEGSKYKFVGNNSMNFQASNGQWYNNCFKNEGDHYVEGIDVDTSTGYKYTYVTDYGNGNVYTETKTFYKTNKSIRLYDTSYEQVRVYRQNYSLEDLQKVLQYVNNTNNTISIKSYNYDKTTDLHEINYTINPSSTVKNYKKTSKDLGADYENYLYNEYTSDPISIFMYKLISDYNLAESDLLLNYMKEQAAKKIKIIIIGSPDADSCDFSELTFTSKYVSDDDYYSITATYSGIGTYTGTATLSLTDLYNALFKDKSTFMKALKEYDTKNYNKIVNELDSSIPTINSLNYSDSQKQALEKAAYDAAVAKAAGSGKTGVNVEAVWSSNYSHSYKDSNYKYYNGKNQYTTRTYTCKASLNGQITYYKPGESWKTYENFNTTGEATLTINLGKASVTDDDIYDYIVSNDLWPEMKLSDTITRDALVNVLDYMYLAGATSQCPTTKISDIVGFSGSENAFDGYKESQIATALVKNYVANDPQFEKTVTYVDENGETVTRKERPSSIVARTAYWYTRNDQAGGNYVYCQITFLCSWNDGSSSMPTLDAGRYGSFKIVTDNPTYGAKYNNKDDENGNPDFTPAILCNDGNFQVGAPITAIEAINRDFKEGYGKKEVSSNYGTYKTVDRLFTSSIKTVNITENTKIDSGYSIKQSTNETAELNIKNGASLYIDGDLTLNSGTKGFININMQEDTLLYINGNLNISYDVSENLISGIISLIIGGGASTAEAFSKLGVNINANGAHIIVNGDVNYKGYKYYSGKIQQTVAAECDSHSQNDTYDYSLDSRAKHPTEPRSLLSATFLVNGDFNFISKTDVESSLNNIYTNPLCNSTFYVDGIFNMTGLWTAGIYDKCRPNFIFARTIQQPDVAWATVFPTKGFFGEDWCSTNGYVFMICEDSINFSELNFAAVNVYTPYDLLVTNLDAHAVSQWNFTEFIDKEAVSVAYKEAEIDRWDLPSILREGMKQVFTYEPGGNGNTTVASKFPQTEGEVDF